MKAPATDQWPRTLFSWQRTLLGIAGVTVFIAFLLLQSRYQVLSVPVLAVALLPFPAALRRGRQLRDQQHAPSDQWTPLALVVVVLVLAAAGLLLVATL